MFLWFVATFDVDKTDLRPALCWMKNWFQEQANYTRGCIQLIAASHLPSHLLSPWCRRVQERAWMPTAFAEALLHTAILIFRGQARCESAHTEKSERVWAIWRLSRDTERQKIREVHGCGGLVHLRSRNPLVSTIFHTPVPWVQGPETCLFRGHSAHKTQQWVMHQSQDLTEVQLCSGIFMDDPLPSSAEKMCFHRPFLDPLRCFFPTISPMAAGGTKEVSRTVPVSVDIFWDTLWDDQIKYIVITSHKDRICINIINIYIYAYIYVLYI